MNRWHVYEFMKKEFMSSGKVPEKAVVFSKFREIPKSEIEEGIAEFHLMISYVGHELKPLNDEAKNAG